MSTASHFEPGEILAVLDRHRVRYVLIGGFAAQLHGATAPTTDIDVTPEKTRNNLANLVSALHELHAGIRVDELPDGLPFDASAESLADMRTLNLRTIYGDLDISFEPSGTAGYADLARAAQTLSIGSVDVDVASLDDIIRSKQAAARPKDLRVLPELERLARDRASAKDA